jgi:hypothetical protein
MTCSRIFVQSGSSVSGRRLRLEVRTLTSHIFRRRLLRHFVPRNDKVQEGLCTINTPFDRAVKLRKEWQFRWGDLSGYPRFNKEWADPSVGPNYLVS